MAFNTKLKLSNEKMYQDALDTLTLNGTTTLVKDDAVIQYSESPTFTGSTKYNHPEVLVTKGYVDQKVLDISAELSSGITSASNGLTKVGVQVELGGTLEKSTTIAGNTNNLTFSNIGTFGVSVTGSAISMSDNKGLLYVGDYSATYEDRSLVDKGYVDTEILGIVSDYDDVLTNGLTGATNGLSVTNSVVSLGGVISATTLNGATTGSFEVKDVASFKVNAVGGSGASLIMTDDKGLMYGAGTIDYQSKTLVDKAYVDAFAYGITPKTSVRVATTANITLSGAQTIDGISVIAGDRVLVKNQTTTSENGIYVVASGAWDRATDFDFSPVSETRLGDLVPVLEGTTNNNTVCALTTFTGSGNPIGFTQFSKLVGISAGNGIDIDTSGGDQKISVDIVASSGLGFDTAKLDVVLKTFHDNLL